MNKTLSKVALTIFVSLASLSANAAIVDSINPTFTGSGGNYNIPNIGFLYEPNFSYLLDGIGAKFGSSDDRSVNVTIYSGLPGNLTYLSSGQLIPIANAFSDASLSPVNINAGVTYFVAFTNVLGLGSNLTLNQPGAIEGTFYYDRGDQSFSIGPISQSTVGPILEFSGVLSAVPEADTSAMLMMGLGFFGFMARSRKNKNKLNLTP